MPSSRTRPPGIPGFPASTTGVTIRGMRRPAPRTAHLRRPADGRGRPPEGRRRRGHELRRRGDPCLPGAGRPAPTVTALTGVCCTRAGPERARCLLRKHGLPGVPVSDGDALGANPLPEAIRSYVDRVVHNAAALGDTALPRCAHGGPRGPDPDRPAGQVHAHRAGPADQRRAGARARPLPRRRIERVFIMGAGTTHGNLCCGAGDGIDHGQEFNFWADPAAAQKVFSALSGKIYLTALNATDFVPITFDFADRLAARTTRPWPPRRWSRSSPTPTCRSSCARASCTGGTRSTRPRRSPAGLVTYEPTRLSVVQSGVEAGRTVVDPRGARIRLGVAADAQAFEDHFLAMLNGRARHESGTGGARATNAARAAARAGRPPAPGAAACPG